MHIKLLLPILLLSIFCINCQSKPAPSEFSEEALNNTFITLQGESVTFQSILDRYKGRTILLDIWASWCRDCIVGLSNLKKVQKDNPDVVYLFLSLDKSQQSWKNGIDKYGIVGAHYFMQSGWEGDFGSFVDLDWIPRYMVINPEGTIALFRAIKANDPEIAKHLK